MDLGRNSRTRGFRPLCIPARSLEKRALQEVGRYRCDLPLIAAVRAAVSGIIDYDPAPVPGPVASRRSPLEALSSSCVDFDAAAAEPTISKLFGRLKLSAVPQVNPPLFELGGARIASESASIVVGSRAKWPLAKCGAAALFCGVTVPPRLTPWAAHGRILASHEAKKSSRLSSFTGFRRLLPRSPDEHIWLQSKLRLKINHWRLSPGVHPREDEIENPSHPPDLS